MISNYGGAVPQTHTFNEPKILPDVVITGHRKKKLDLLPYILILIIIFIHKF